MGLALSEMKLTSPAFQARWGIPAKHTGEGDDVSPPLAWSDAPEGTKSFAVICHHPDTPLLKPGTYGFDHWVLYGIPGDVRELSEGVSDYAQGSNGRISIIGGGVCEPVREGVGRREMVPPEPVGNPRVGDSTIPNERRHRWNGTSGWTPTPRAAGWR